MSIDAWAQVAIFTHFYSYMDPVWSLSKFGTCCHMIGSGCTLGRAPRTEETLPDFHEWCRVTQHQQIFRGLTGCQRDTPVLGCHSLVSKLR